MNKLCECGCGKEILNLSNRFFSTGHALAFRNKDPEFRKKQRDGMIKKYGVDIAMKSPEIRKKYEDTNLKHCGYKNPNQDPKIKLKKIKTNQEHCGCDNPSQDPLVKEKKRITNQEHWNTDFPMQSKKIQKKYRNTCKEKYNVETSFESEQAQQTYRSNFLKKHGVEWPFQLKSIIKVIKIKSRQTNLRVRNVENAMQDPEVFEKMIKSSFRRKEYTLPSGKIILLQGEEPSFLDYVFKNQLLKEEEIEIHPKRIKYVTEDGKSHYYFADFRLIPFDLIVEIKSWYILSIQKNTDLKIAATKDLGHKYIMILDKNYEEFTQLLQQLRKELL